jgi:DeoR/GlpR family transcriptional regulator of sugar metabolism
MNVSKRQEQILELLREQGFITVENLSKSLYTSPASIRRDLTRLEDMCFLKRTHGGASVLNDINHAIPLNSRMTKNIINKKKIASIASSLIKDGQIIMLDGSTTASFLVPHIAKRKNVVLFTNNMITAINAINYGIKTHCIGGTSVNNSAVLSGPNSYEEVSKIRSNICFFSSNALDENGVISDPTEEENHLRYLMLKNTDTSVFLCDSEKFDRRSIYTLTTIDKVDFVVFDSAWDKLKIKCNKL